MKSNIFWSVLEAAGSAVFSLAAAFIVAGRADTLVSKLSHGEQRELELAVALATKPRLLLLDEPMAGLGITESARMVKLLQELRREVTIVLVEHDMDFVIGVVDRIVVMDFGCKLTEGTPAAVRADARVQEAYLGGVT